MSMIVIPIAGLALICVGTIVMGAGICAYAWLRAEDGNDYD